MNIMNYYYYYHYDLNKILTEFLHSISLFFPLFLSLPSIYVDDFRRRKGEKLFLVAFYECDEDYELENLEQDRLYCSRERWVGTTPKCNAINDDGEDEEDDDENGGEEGTQK